MKRIQELCAATMLMLVLSLSALAGEIHTNAVPPPPPPPASATATQPDDATTDVIASAKCENTEVFSACKIFCRSSLSADPFYESSTVRFNVWSLAAHCLTVTRLAPAFFTFFLSRAAHLIAIPEPFLTPKSSGDVPFSPSQRRLRSNPPGTPLPA